MECKCQGCIEGMDDRRVDQAVARGVLPQANVNPDVLDPSRGLSEGRAELARKYPMMASLGSYRIQAQTWLIDDKWQYQQMGIGSNFDRRVPVIYNLSKAPPAIVQAFVHSVSAIVAAPFSAQLSPLDNDPDFIYYNMLFGLGGPRDFHPRVQVMCTLDHALTDMAVQRLIDQIQGRPRPHVASVAEQMTGAFLWLYENALENFQAILMQKKPPPAPAMVALAHAQIPILQGYIAALKKSPASGRPGSGKQP
jgi:hypothetical protein